MSNLSNGPQHSVEVASNPISYLACKKYINIFMNLQVIQSSHISVKTDIKLIWIVLKS